MRKLKERMTKKKAALLAAVVLAVCILVGFVHKQSEIKAYKEWMNLHSYELYKDWSSLEDGAGSYALMTVDLKIYEGLYKDAPNKKLEEAQTLYVEAMELYADALEEFENETVINTDLISEADEKIDAALDIVND